MTKEATVKTTKTNRQPKFVLVTIVADCPFKGKQCVLQGKAEIENNGFESTQVYRCCNGRRKEHKGCVFEYITERESQNYERGFPEAIVTCIGNMILFMHPAIAGKNDDTGEEVLMSTTEDMKARGFIPAKVRAIVDKDIAYKGWRFTRLAPKI